MRRALYMTVQCGLRKGVNERLKAYYEKKRKEGKPYKVAVIACANKLLHHVHAILVKGEPYKAACCSSKLTVRVSWFQMVL